LTLQGEFRGMRFFSWIANDGSRNFVDLPETVDWWQLRDHLKKLPGVTITGFVTDGITEAWIDFSYRGHKFSVNNQYGDYWFFVADPECLDEILLPVAHHAASLLGPPR
jgi:hypothetical protein